jgi:hypothetical protein
VNLSGTALFLSGSANFVSSALEMAQDCGGLPSEDRG